MCDSIRLLKGEDVTTVRQFENHFKVDSKEYGFDGNADFLDCCLCQINLTEFFNDRTDLNFIYENGDWWQSDAQILI